MAAASLSLSRVKHAFISLYRGDATWRGALEAAVAGAVIMICMHSIKSSGSNTQYQPPPTTYTAPAAVPPAAQQSAAPKPGSQLTLSAQDLNAIRKASGNNVIPLASVAPLVVKPSITSSEAMLPPPAESNPQEFGRLRGKSNKPKPSFLEDKKNP
jgi:hypothetical protein